MPSRIAIIRRVYLFAALLIALIAPPPMLCAQTDQESVVPPEPSQVSPGITLSTGDAEFTTPIPSALDDAHWYGPDGSRRPLWRWLPPSNGRHRGIGRPLEHDSWLNRPFQISPLIGGLVADQFLKGRVDGSSGFLSGFRIGWDFDHFWGLETRFGFSSIGLDDPTGAVSLGNAQAFLFDGGLMWYPWGDSQWRPYATIGLGLADFHYNDEFGQQNHPTAFTMPFGGGVKYRHDHRWAFRFDVIDDLAFDAGRQGDLMHNLLITAGIEARIGFGPRRSYYPWTPSRAWY